MKLSLFKEEENKKGGELKFYLSANDNVIDLNANDEKGETYSLLRITENGIRLFDTRTPLPRDNDGKVKLI